MDVLIWIGAAVSLAGVGILIWCIWAAIAARRAALDDDAMRARLRRLSAFNMAALGVSGIGLMLVVTGVILA
ncbi:MAG: hypothetical protein AAF667_05885 [Pseudomonadota bacterium]